MLTECQTIEFVYENNPSSHFLKKVHLCVYSYVTFFMCLTHKNEEKIQDKYTHI